MNEAILARVREWRYDPVAFVRDCIQVEPSEQQLEGLIALRDGPTKGRRITIRSGHGTGKDAWASWVILWYMTTRKDAKIACVAPTARQLQDILWSELGKWLARSKVADEFVKQKQKFFHKEHPDTWWVRTISPSAKASVEEQAETLAGLHGDHFVVLCDEASGIVDPVYTTLEGALTQEDNWAILIGNMTKNRGYFYDSHFHHEHSNAWNKLHWNSKLSSNVKESYCNYMAKKYGVDSNVYRIRVLGDPPLDSENTLIPLAWAQQCIGTDVEVAEDEPLYLGVDVARYGDDSSVVLPRQGLKISPWKEYNGLNTITLGGHILETYDILDAEGLAIDEIGVGAGVTDWIYKHGHPRCFGVNVSASSSDITKYERLRDELWVAVRDKCMRGVYSFPEELNIDGLTLGQVLADELSSVRYDFNSHGGIKVESKKDMKKRGVASPNIADALCLSEYFHAVATKVWARNGGQQRKKKSRRIVDQVNVLGRDSWMVM